MIFVTSGTSAETPPVMTASSRLKSSVRLLLGVWLLSTIAVRGQSLTRMEGKILDQGGAGIAGATVTLFSDDRARTVKAGEGGEFTFSGLKAPAHFLEASSPGFFSGSVPITNQTGGPVTIVLAVGGGSQCAIEVVLLSYSEATYEDSSSKVQLTGTVTDFLDAPLPNASLNLMKADLSVPEAKWPGGLSRVPSMTERRFRFWSVAQGSSNERGEFEFAGLEPGWYSLLASHEGYHEQIAKFWIARETLTRTTRIHLNRTVDAGGCDTIFGPIRIVPMSPASN